MANHHLFVLAIEADDEKAAELKSQIESALVFLDLAPSPCQWAPDLDTVADGLGVDYADLEVHDLNPAVPA